MILQFGIGALAVFFAYCVYEEDKKVRGEFKPLKKDEVFIKKVENDKLSINRLDIEVPSATRGWKLHAWLYAPTKLSNEGLPIVVMAHGFGAQKDFGLEKFAQRFAENGFAVLVFDYRCWGGSDGTPRNLISVKDQHQDWFTVLDFVYSNLNEAVSGVVQDLGVEKLINPERIGIWGSSFAGAHTIAVAGLYKTAERIKAIVSQVPYADGVETLPKLLMTMGPIWALKLTANSLKDMVRSTLGLSRHYMPIIGEHLNKKGKQTTSNVGIIATDECSLYWTLINQNVNERLGGWQNRVPAAIALQFPLYRPTTYARKVKAPVLGIFAKKDSLCPLNGVKKMFISTSGPTDLVELDCGHFDPYLTLFEEVVTEELEFFKEKL